MNANTTAAATFQVGQVLAEPLVTDTITYEVVKTTAHTVTVRRTQDGGEPIRDLKVDQGPYPVLWTPQVPCPEAATRTLRIRKDGSIRFGGGYKLRLAPIVGGEPVRRVDYRY